MTTLPEMFDELTKKKHRLSELKAQSPELAEAIKLAEDTQALQEEIIKRCNQPAYIPVPYPYPVYPGYYSPWHTIKITCGTYNHDGLYGVNASSAIGRTTVHTIGAES